MGINLNIISIDVSTFGQVNYCDATMLKMLRLVDLMLNILSLMQGQCKIYLTMFPFGRAESEQNSLSCKQLESYQIISNDRFKKALRQ